MRKDVRHQIKRRIISSVYADFGRLVGAALEDAKKWCIPSLQKVEGRPSAKSDLYFATRWGVEAEPEAAAYTPDDLKIFCSTWRLHRCAGRDYQGMAVKLNAERFDQATRALEAVGIVVRTDGYLGDGEWVK